MPTLPARLSRIALAATFLAGAPGCAALRDPTPTLDAFLAEAGNARPALRYEEHGSGPPIVLIHGLGTSRFSWRHLVEPLARHGRVIALDLKGFGDSPKPTDRNYSIYDQAVLVHDLIDRLALRDVTLVGHSLGGGVALATALKLEQQGELRRLVLIDSIGYEQRFPAFVTLLKTPLLGYLSVHLLPARLQVRALLRAAFHDPARIEDAAVETYARGLRTPEGKHAILQSARQIVPKDLATLTANYPTIRAPALILWGREDTITPLQVGRRLHDALPNSRLVVLDGVGHIPHEEAPGTVAARITAFLTGSVDPHRE